MLFKHASNSIVETSLITSCLGRTRTPLNWTHWKNGDSRSYELSIYPCSTCPTFFFQTVCFKHNSSWWCRKSQKKRLLTLFRHLASQKSWSWKCLQLIISSVSPSKSAIQYCTITLESSQCVRRDPNNYRPISVISVMGKVFERVVHVRLMNVQYLNDNSILTLFQSGFRPNHSTEDVLLCTVEDWYRSGKGSSSCIHWLEQGLWFHLPWTGLRTFSLVDNKELLLMV